MTAVVMTILLLGGWGGFAYSARRRWKLLKVGVGADRFDRPGERLRRLLKYGIAQVRMRRYPLAGAAHMLIFLGFLILLPRTLVLWGRAFDPSFDLWVLGTDGVLGKVYAFFKDAFAVLVILGTLVFLYYRVVKRLSRLTLSKEGLLILGIIITMMFADLLYDGARAALNAPAVHSHVMVSPRRLPGEPNKREVISPMKIASDRGNVAVVPASVERELMGEEIESLRPGRPKFGAYEPAGSLVGKALAGLPSGALTFLASAGYWTHATLVLIFLNLLPYSKHFHIITALPNVYLQDLGPRGRLAPIEDIDGKLEREETLGVRRIDQFSWKAILDLYTCTECGRCSDHCPATRTGKRLSPKHFTLDLRDFLYANEKALVAAKNEGNGRISGDHTVAPETVDAGGTDGAADEAARKDLVDSVIDPEVLWACTTCRACEEECPVFISYVDKIVDMRRYLVQERGEFPPQLQSAFRGMETNANPWSFPAGDRANWASDLGIKTLAEHPQALVLLWVGCMPSFDERAKKISRATARLLQRAGVDFAILGAEEQCTGDPARRAGNEYLFQMFAKANVETMSNYGVDQKTIVTSCPHCFNTLLNEYPDFGGKYQVVHHSTYLANLLRDGKLQATHRRGGKVVYHDSCYLGRYNDVYEAPREALKSIGLTVLEPVQTRDRGMCCGAGGAQMFKEEEPGTQRVNSLRTLQLLETKPDAVATACPFCMRMLTDGLAEHHRDDVAQKDIAELLAEACLEEFSPA